MSIPSTKRTFFYSFLLILIALTTSCSKDHDLISDYMIATPLEVSSDQKTSPDQVESALKPE